MRRALMVLIVLVLAGTTACSTLTVQHRIDAASLPKHKPDLRNGEYMFAVGGCASCHAAPASAKCDDPKSKNKLKLAGGRCLITPPFGTFHVPNISPHVQSGIGGWTTADFVNAMVRGISPQGTHYYPAFPYMSYQRMRIEDIIDLKAYLDTLPPVETKAKPHELAWPYGIRSALGFWKTIYLDGKPFTPLPGKSAQINRGAYLVQGPGHCGECHTPRDKLGGFIDDASYSGAVAPDGGGAVPNITPHRDGIGDWSAQDIAYALKTGVTPSFDTFGGSMVAVQENMKKLTPQDRAAIAAYLKALPPVANGGKK